jgi:hypothetical protein
MSGRAQFHNRSRCDHLCVPESKRTELPTPACCPLQFNSRCKYGVHRYSAQRTRLTLESTAASDKAQC